MHCPFLKLKQDKDDSLAGHQLMQHDRMETIDKSLVRK